MPQNSYNNEHDIARKQKTQKSRGGGGKIEIEREEWGRGNEDGGERATGRMEKRRWRRERDTNGGSKREGEEVEGAEREMMK